MPIVSFSQMQHAAIFGVKFSVEEWRNRSVNLAPADAVARDLCPETGAPLVELNIADHIKRTWPKDRNADALQRIGMLEKWQEEHAFGAEA